MRTRLFWVITLFFGLTAHIQAQCIASFTYTTGSNGLLSLTSTSTGTNAGTRYTWFMGNGVKLTNVADTAGYAYCFNGTYQVSLLLQDSIGSCWDSTATTVTISNAPNTNCLPANFTYTVSGGQAACTLTSPTAYNTWNFGDNSYLSYNTTNPVHNYTHNGTYTVTCYTQYQYGSFNVYIPCDTFSQVITLTNVPCVASFWADSNNYNNKLYLYSTAQGDTAIYYSANGGPWVHGVMLPAVVDSFMNLPAGNNTICQKVYGNGCVDSLCKTVLVNCMISETHTATCGQVSFTTTANPGITSASWYIGGSLVSTQANPVISYTNTSSFYISYNLQTSLCTKTDCVLVQVGPTPMFWIYPDSIAGPHNWIVSVDNQASYATYDWNWGDGTTSSTPYPTHTYTVGAWYNICLTIHDVCGDSATYCQNDSLYRTSSSMIGIVVQPQNAGVGIASHNGGKLNVYPVPASDLLMIENLQGTIRAEIFDNEGRKVLSEPLSATEKTIINIQTLAKGFYLLKVYSADGIVQKKIIKQ